MACNLCMCMVCKCEYRRKLYCRKFKFVAKIQNEQFWKLKDTNGTRLHVHALVLLFLCNGPCKAQLKLSASHKSVRRCVSMCLEVSIK